MISSMMPYSFASSAVMMKSRSVSFDTFSIGWPVCSAISWSSSSRYAHDLLGLDLDVDRLALRAAVRLVDQDARVREGEPLAGRAGEQQHRGGRRRLAHQMVDTSGLMYCIVS